MIDLKHDTLIKHFIANMGFLTNKSELVVKGSIKLIIQFLK